MPGLFAIAGFTVVAKVGCDAMGPTVSDFSAIVVFALGHERLGWVVALLVWWLELNHHCFENIFDVVGSECSVGLVGRWCVRISVFVARRFRLLLVEGHLVDEMFELFVDDVGDDGDIVCGVAGV